MKLPAPIVLFVFNRPKHTQQVLNSLAANNLASKSKLYIFCDGLKPDSSAQAVEKNKQVREVVKKENRFQEVIIVEQNTNKGLANSIIDGVTEVINKHESVIVLEDDLILSPYFLDYMNDSLGRYNEDQRVGAIGACNFFACSNAYPPFFFLSHTDCLGWATWKNRWDLFDPDSSSLLEKLKDGNLVHKFNAYGSYDNVSMLKEQIKGKISSWAIRWAAVCVLNDLYTLYPNPSMSNHLESEESTHAHFNITPPLVNKAPVFETIEVKENSKVVQAMKLGYSGYGDYYGNLKKGLYKKLNLREKILFLKKVLLPNRN